MKLIPSESSAPTQLLSRQHFVRISPLAATLMDLPASVANKRLTAELSPLAATLTKNRGVGGAPLFVRSDNDAHPEFANGGGAEGFFSGLTLLYCCAPRAFHNSFTTKRFRTLSQNCRGVAQQFPFWELFAGHSAERPLFSSSLFYGLHTLPSFVSRNSFACHSYENCRVYTNSSQNGTCQPAYRGQDYPSHRCALRLSNSSTLEPFNSCTIRPHFRVPCLFLSDVFYLSGFHGQRRELSKSSRNVATRLPGAHSAQHRPQSDWAELSLARAVQRFSRLGDVAPHAHPSRLARHTTSVLVRVLSGTLRRSHHISRLAHGFSG